MRRRLDAYVNGDNFAHAVRGELQCDEQSERAAWRTFTRRGQGERAGRQRRLLPTLFDGHFLGFFKEPFSMLKTRRYLSWDYWARSGLQIPHYQLDRPASSPHKRVASRRLNSPIHLDTLASPYPDRTHSQPGTLAHMKGDICDCCVPGDSLLGCAVTSTAGGHRCS